MHAIGLLDSNPTHRGNTPGALDESNLNEPAGMGSGTADLTYFDDGACGFGFQPTHGPLDFDGDGDFTGTHVSADLIRQDHPGVMDCPRGFTQVLTGHTDWGPAPGQSIFNYKFQFTPLYADGSPPPASLAQNELTPQLAAETHSLYPLRPVKIVLRPACSGASKLASPGHPGLVRVAVLSEDDFDAGDIDTSSLNLHGAHPQSTSVQDVDGDGKPDLVVTFGIKNIKLRANATSVIVTGWLKNSQSFVGEANVPSVAGIGSAAAGCRAF